jgi:hypothetical protein
MVARRYWHLGRASNDGHRDAWHGPSGSTSAAFVCRRKPASCELRLGRRERHIVSAEYVKVRAPFDSGPSNQDAALLPINSAGTRTSSRCVDCATRSPRARRRLLWPPGDSGCSTSNSRCGSRTRSTIASKARAHPHADRRAPCERDVGYYVACSEGLERSRQKYGVRDESDCLCALRSSRLHAPFDEQAVWQVSSND